MGPITNLALPKGQTCDCLMPMASMAVGQDVKNKSITKICTYYTTGLCSTQIFRADSTLTHVPIQVIQL